VTNIDGVIAGVDTWDEAVFKLAPKLKVIARFGVGIDNIDIMKAHEYGIKVTNVPGKNSNAVAELAVGFMIGALRSIPKLHQSARRGYWDRTVGSEMVGRNVSLLGFGNIAQMVAKKLAGFDVNLFAYDKYPNDEAAKLHNVSLVSFEEALRVGDIVSMHMPSLKETYHAMSAAQFAMMKDRSYFINTARGMLVDEAALYEALHSGKLAGAAIDVYEREPVPVDNPLFQLDNIITTPHTAGETYEVYHAVSLVTAQAVLDVFAGNKPDNSIE
jgi:D-3-phosphoglycerate dehydrogenase